jgi:hypothetical protein
LFLDAHLLVELDLHNVLVVLDANSGVEGEGGCADGSSCRGALLACEIHCPIVARRALCETGVAVKVSAIAGEAERSRGEASSAEVRAGHTVDISIGDVSSNRTGCVARTTVIVLGSGVTVTVAHIVNGHSGVALT